MTLENEIYKSPKSKTVTISTIFLALVVLLTIVLYWYNYYISWVNNDLKNEISAKQKLVAEKKQEKKLKVYSLYMMNKSVIDKLEKYSKIRTFINHLDLISSKYWISFKGFNYSNWELKTTAYSVSDSKSIDYQKTVNFLRNYKADKKALFNIVPLKWVETLDSKQKFTITFKIK
jgi:hypothetical protein